MTKYMHTIDGEPGDFRGKQICFAGFGAITLCDTLYQIRKEQKATRKYRLSQGFHIISKYGYVKVKTT